MSLHGPNRRLPEVVVLPRLFGSVVLSSPISPALKDAHEETWVSYKDLNLNANKLARCLLKRIEGVTCRNPDGDRIVAVCMAPSTHLVTALLAILKTGGAYLPLDVTFPESRVTQILQGARPLLLLAHGHPSAIVAAEISSQKENSVTILHLEDLLAEMEEESGEELEVDLMADGSSIATVLYTSGSTGVPKGVRISHRAVLNRLAWQWHTFPYQKDEVCCFKTALTFVDSISEIFGPLLTGHKVIVVPKSVVQSVDDFVNLLKEERVGRLVLVPTLLRSILLHCSLPDSPKLPHLRLWVCSGEVLPQDLLISFFKVFKEGQSICNFYGSTEVMGDVTYLQFFNSADAEGKLIDNQVPIGTPVTNCSIYLLDSEGEQVVTDGKIGEVFVAGLSVASGCVGGAGSDDKFITNTHCNDQDFSCLYRTGDYGRVVDGMVIFEGRTDSQIKVRGHRVDLNEVQAAVQKLDSIDKAYVICYKPGKINQGLIAFCTSPEERLDTRQLTQSLHQHLQPYMLPKLVQVAELPLLVNGKVNRQQLLKDYESAEQAEETKMDICLTDVDPGDEAGASDLLLTVAKVLGSSIFGGSKLSLEDNFFEIGGNSLNAVLTVTSLEDLNYQIDISQFLKAKTLRQVLTHMKKMKHLEEPQNRFSSCRGNYIIQPFTHKYIDEVLEIVSIGMSQKGELDFYLKAEPWEYVSVFKPTMEHFIELGKSFVVTRPETDEVVATGLNYEHVRPPDFEKGLTPRLSYLLEILVWLESTIKGKLLVKDEDIFQGLQVSVKPSLSAAESVELVRLAEEENIRIAEQYGFKAIITNNESLLTQQVCDDLLSYEVAASCQVNVWEAKDGTRPYGKAPDSQRLRTSVRYL